MEYEGKLCVFFQDNQLYAVVGGNFSKAAKILTINEEDTGMAYGLRVTCDRCAEDIRCIAGTGDMRAGLFEADGEYVEENGLGVFGSIFEGYVGYNFRFGPNMDPDTPTRWVDCRDEVHKTGNFGKKYASADNLMTYNVGLMDNIPGFGLAPGEWSLWTISLERLSSSTVRMSITLNDTTYTEIDDSGDDLPDKIDVFAIHMRNGRPYDRLVLANDPQ
jgi:hypothetical protein